MTFRDAIIVATDSMGVSLRKLADRSGVSYEQLKKLKQGKSQSTNVDDAMKVAQALGLTFDQLISGDYSEHSTVAIAGKVGAGAQVPVFDAYEKGDGPQVEAPPQISASGVVAVEIEGDSMEPVYSAGDLLFYSRVAPDAVPTEAINHRCVCEDENSMGWVKQVKRGTEPGMFHLISLNPGAETMWDVRLKWAAPVKFYLPAEFARKV